ncbi:MAG TPA: hypothetical protein VGJ08_16295, partial [Rhizomicrobium sp.]
ASGPAHFYVITPALVSMIIDKLAVTPVTLIDSHIPRATQRTAPIAQRDAFGHIEPEGRVLLF